MFIFHWLAEQGLLTLQQIQADITIPHLVTGVIFYRIIHSAAKSGILDGKRTRKLFKTEMHKYIYQHVGKQHKGHPVKCAEPECEPIKILTDPQLK